MRDDASRVLAEEIARIRCAIAATAGRVTRLGPRWLMRAEALTEGLDALRTVERAMDEEGVR